MTFKQFLIEALSNQDQRFFSQYDLTSADTAQAGPYTLHLIKSNTYPMVYTKDNEPIHYQIGLQYGNRGFTQPSDQMKQQSDQRGARTSDMKLLRHQVIHWKHLYGPIAIQSYDTTKNQRYKRFFDKIGIPTHSFDHMGLPGFYI